MVPSRNLPNRAGQRRWSPANLPTRAEAMTTPSLLTGRPPLITTGGVFRMKW